MADTPNLHLITVRLNSTHVKLAMVLESLPLKKEESGTLHFLHQASLEAHLKK